MLSTTTKTMLISHFKRKEKSKSSKYDDKVLNVLGGGAAITGGLGSALQGYSSIQEERGTKLIGKAFQNSDAVSGVKGTNLIKSSVKNANIGRNLNKVGLGLGLAGLGYMGAKKLRNRKTRSDKGQSRGRYRK